MRNTEAYKICFREGFDKGFATSIEEIVKEVSDIDRVHIAMISLNYLPFTEILKNYRVSYHQAMAIVEQAIFEEYVKDEFDLYVENDGFLTKKIWRESISIDLNMQKV
jgi:hypothetical protein